MSRIGAIRTLDPIAFIAQVTDAMSSSAGYLDFAAKQLGCSRRQLSRYLLAPELAGVARSKRGKRMLKEPASRLVVEGLILDAYASSGGEFGRLTARPSSRWTPDSETESTVKANAERILSWLYDDARPVTGRQFVSRIGLTAWMRDEALRRRIVSPAEAALTYRVAGALDEYLMDLVFAAEKPQ